MKRHFTLISKKQFFTNSSYKAGIPGSRIAFLMAYSRALQVIKTTSAGDCFVNMN
jgi:hypothetical protein